MITKLLRLIDRLDLFPQIQITCRKYSPRATLLIFAALFILFFALAHLIPCNGFFCFDWVNVFSVGRTPAFYPPWDGPILAIMNYPVMMGLSLAAFALATFLRARSPVSLMCAFLCLPVLWTIFLGQLEGLSLLGIIGLPWLAPLALVKPQITAFAFMAKKSYIVSAVVVLAVSLLTWGLWPLRMFSVNQYYAEGRYPQDISLGLYGILPALVMLWFSRGDVDMLLLSGSMMTLHLIPYNLFPAVPAVARLSRRGAVIALVLSWLPLSANWLGPWGWWLGWLFVLFVWCSLAASRYPRARWACLWTVLFGRPVQPAPQQS